MPSSVVPTRYARMTRTSSAARLRVMPARYEEIFALLLHHIRFHGEVLGQPQAIQFRRGALVPCLDPLPELALVVAAGKGRRVLLRLMLEDCLDLESQLLLRQRHEPSSFM